MKKLLYLIVITILASGCHKTIYNMNRGELKIAKKDTYQVEYITEIPAGTKAKMYYIGEKNVQYFEEDYTGKFHKTYTIISGKAIKFNIDVKLPKTKPEGGIHTIVKVDGEAITDQTQSGTDIDFRFQFKLP
ncbi:MAG: hypothetical protein JKY70_22450 [Mucilaginibacter sp.]|nr:hypothetical protein [Mucilaginibacter sp.]